MLLSLSSMLLEDTSYLAHALYYVIAYAYHYDQSGEDFLTKR